MTLNLENNISPRTVSHVCISYQIYTKLRIASSDVKAAALLPSP